MLLLLALIVMAIWLGGKGGDVSVMTGHTVYACLVPKPLTSIYLFTALSLMGIVHYGSKSYSGHYESECKGKDCEEQDSHEKHDDMKDSDTCSNSSVQCDGIQNCQEASDETNCGEHTFYSKEADYQM